jgi:hypothetical protein
MIDISYDITRTDLFAFQMRASTKSPLARRMLRETWITYAVVVVVMAFLTTPWKSLVALGGFAVFCIVFIGGGVWFYRYSRKKLIAEYVRDETPEKGQLGWHRLQADQNGLTETTAVGESRVSWEGVQRIERDSAGVYVYTGSHQAHVIPLRAFASSRDAENFYSFMKSHAANVFD